MTSAKDKRQAQPWVFWETERPVKGEWNVQKGEQSKDIRLLGEEKFGRSSQCGGKTWEGLHTEEQVIWSVFWNCHLAFEDWFVVKTQSRQSQIEREVQKDGEYDNKQSQQDLPMKANQGSR